MKKITFCVIASILAVSCIKFENKDDAASETQTKPDTEKQCYLYAVGKDSIMLSIAKNSNNVHGEMQFKYSEKDNSNGTLSGLFIGDTLFADYRFRSEGTTSTREVVFLHRGDRLLVGSGEMETRGDKSFFAANADVTFDEATALKKIDCR